MEYKDYYRILGVDKKATDKDIKRAYRKLARQYHPDVNPGDKKAEDKFKHINEAYEVLGDPQKRAKYDQLGSSWAQWQRMGRDPGGFDWGRWAAQGGNVRVDDLSDLFGGGAFSDFFNTIFGGPGAAAQTRRPRTGRLRGEDYEQPVEITLEEAHRGATREFERDGRRVTATIPRGAKTGTKVRLRGQSGSGFGQDYGDLYLAVTVLPHPRFERKEDDLYAELPIDLYTAVLGGEVRVATLDGDVILKVPPESQGGQTFRLRGRGMPKLRRPDDHGDLFVKLSVQVPKNLTAKERTLFEELARLRKK